MRQRQVGVDGVVGHHERDDGSDAAVANAHDEQRGHDAQWQRALRVDDLLARGRDAVEADEGVEALGRTAQHAAEAERQEAARSTLAVTSLARQRLVAYWVLPGKVRLGEKKN